MGKYQTALSWRSEQGYKQFGTRVAFEYQTWLLTQLYWTQTGLLLLRCISFTAVSTLKSPNGNTYCLTVLCNK